VRMRKSNDFPSQLVTHSQTTVWCKTHATYIKHSMCIPSMIARAIMQLTIGITDILRGFSQSAEENSGSGLSGKAEEFCSHRVR
jgi:hypothetical protein